LQDLIAQTCNSGISSDAAAACANTPYSIHADVPDVMGNPPNHHGIANVNTIISCFEQTYGNRTIEIDGNAPITFADLHFEGYDGSPTGDDYAWYSLTWTSTSTSVMIKMAPRASVGFGVCGYGSCYGAGAISGGPYHFMLELLDGKSLGRRDNQVMVDVLDCNLNLPVVFGAATATDNCDANPAIDITVLDAVSAVGQNAIQHCRTWTATDDCGNVSQCSQCIRIDCGNTANGEGNDSRSISEGNVEGVSYQAYPNPFKSSVTIEFTSETSAHSTIEIYTMTGKKVATLLNENTEAGSTYKSELNAEGLTDGIYMYRITNGGHIINGKLTLIK